MSFKQTYEIINLLAGTASTNEKLEILKENTDNEELKALIRYTLSPRVKYFIKSVSVPGTINRNVEMDLMEAINKLHDVRTRRITGHAARDYIADIFSKVLEDDEVLLRNMLDSDLRCGVNFKAVNKVWDNMIKYPKVQLADTNLDNISYPAYSQLKADGVRALYEGGVFQSRNGSVIDTGSTFNSLIRYETAHEKTVYLDGELVCFDDETPMDRKTSNGIINKAIKDTITKEETEMIRYLVWDILTPELENAPYTERLEFLTKFVDDHPNLILIESRVVNSYQKALDHFIEVRGKGLEGTILKNMGSIFENKRSKNLVKMKAEYEADMLVTGYELGTGKNKNRIGNLFVESACGQVKTSVGVFKDFPEEVRDEWMTDTPKIVTILYNERITAKNRKEQSLFLPRVIQVRNDKDEADDLEKMIKEEEAVYVQ